MWNFMWLDIDSNMQTDDSKWLDSFWDSTRPNQDSDTTRKIFRWLDSDSKGLWLWLDSDLIKMTRENHCKTGGPNEP